MSSTNLELIWDPSGVFYWLQLIVCSYQLAATTTILSIGFHLSFFDSQVIIHTSVYHIFSEEISSKKKQEFIQASWQFKLTWQRICFLPKQEEKGSLIYSNVSDEPGM